MKHDVLQVLGQSLKKVLTTHSSYIGSADVNWEDVAAQVILQCDGKVAIMSADVFDAIAYDAAAEEHCFELDNIPASESLDAWIQPDKYPIPYELTAVGKLYGRTALSPKITWADCEGPVSCGGGRQCDKHADLP